MRYGIALGSAIDDQALKHLIRDDRQEDLCFAIWNPSRGLDRRTALIIKLILPMANDRKLHGNASFSSDYFERALTEAVKKKTGLALIHSHPFPGWQGMSKDDIAAEEGHAPAVLGATGLPFVGLTMGTDGALSGRFWEKIGPRKYQRVWCESVRVVGNDFKITFNENILAKPKFREDLIRTRSAWGDEKQGILGRLHIGIIGLGSVGSIVAESLARMGISKITLLDFDSLEILNLDRILHGSRKYVGQAKVRFISNALRNSATADNFSVRAVEWSVVEDLGFREALDCDILFSCVDRPWARAVLNFIAYAHLIPVVDGGILVKTKKNGTLRSADWKAHVVCPGRICMECLGQYDPGLVQAEREGYLEDPRYIQSLSEDHILKRNENVFAFSLSAASMQVLQMLSMIIAPLGISNIGAINYHFTIGHLDTNLGMCRTNCLYPGLTATGDNTTLKVTGKDLKAEKEREKQEKQSRQFKERVNKYLAVLMSFVKKII